MKYIGRYNNGNYQVSIQEAELGLRPLPPCNHLMNHSPDGFAWGYGGSGPAQLALAICASRVPEDVALDIYQSFKHLVVAKLPQMEDFVLESDVVDEVIARLHA